MTAQNKTKALEPLGRWRKPPLAYVVAELAIAPHYGLSARIAALQDQLRNTYPRTIEASELVVAAQAPLASGLAAPQASPPQPFWQMFDAEQTRAVLITYRAVALHATAYTDSDDFLRRWLEVLAAIEKARLELFVERAGLRYVDLIVPTTDHQPVDYLAPALQGVDPPLVAQVQSRATGSTYLVDDMTIQVRTAAPAPANIMMPPNFNALQLKAPAIAQEASARLAQQKAIGWIDTDVGRAVQQPFSTGSMSAMYSKLHQTVSATFKTLLSDHAKQEWI